jgi:excinuclease UvrABC nuclease subunit
MTQGQDLPKILYSMERGLSTMNPKIGTRRTVTLAWQRYLPFSLANVQAYAPVQSGVYKIALELISGRKRVVYVGQANDLDARLKEHLSEWESNLDLYNLVRQYQCSFALAAVSLQADRDAAERALYLYFRPSCNTQEPAGPAYTVTPLTSA